MAAKKSNLEDAYITTKIDNQFDLLKKKYKREASTYLKALSNFIDMENELDHSNENEDEASSRRRKGNGCRNFEFHGVPHKDAVEDLNDIYGKHRADEKRANFRNFKKNDCVSCVLDKKRYKGAIIQINQRGLVIKTKDRRKIKASWEDIDDEEIKIVKLNNLE